jgi:membrane-bound lytic murein transglycosylase D
MARKLAFYTFMTALLYSCAAIKPLSLEEKKPASTLGLSPSLEDKELLNELDHVDQWDEGTVVKIQENDKDLIQQENEIIKKYEQEVLKKEDPVNTVAETEPELVLDYKKKHYDFWINYYTKRDAARFKRHVKNGVKFKKIVEKVFEEEGLPKDLFYVGLIESGFNTHIRSRASAVGPWQFIKGTAVRYTLRVDKQIDERRSIYKATYGAAQYFKDLYNIFGSWELALCAYNAGEYRIINAIRKGNTRDYKALVSKKLLPKETIFYIPKVVAAKKLFQSVSKQIKSTEAKFYENVKEIEVEKPISLKKISRKTKISRKVLKKLNPDIRWDFVSKRRKGYKLYVPEKSYEVASSFIDSLPSRKKRSYRRVASANGTHRVKRGESLYRIARKYGTSISRIKRINKLRRNRIFPGQKLKVPNSDQKVYVVRRGDNLSQIARKFGVSVRRIVQANNLSKKTIYPKQKIILPI